MDCIKPLDASFLYLENGTTHMHIVPIDLGRPVWVDDRPVWVDEHRRTPSSVLTDKSETLRVTTPGG